MNTDAVAFGPSLPAAIQWSAVLFLTILIVLVCRRQRSILAVFVIGAVWLRYMLSALHQITYDDAFAGLSWNALASVSVFLTGLVLIDKRLLLHKALLPIYLLLTLIVISGLLNGSVAGMINSGVKYGYFVVIMLAVYQILRDELEPNLLSWLLWSFSPLLVLQVLSVVFGVSKLTETDGSVSYIGGYNHEAAFSLSLTACFFTAVFARGISPVLRQGILVLVLVGIFLANYRTVMLTLAPLALFQFGLAGVASVRREQRALVTILAVIVALGAVGFGATALSARFADLGTVASEGGAIIKPPGEFSPEDRRVLSGRPYIWSYYLYGAAEGSALQSVIGLGPESWVGRFRLYAHNTLVASYYELGWLGVIATLLLWMGMLLRAVQTSRDVRARLLTAHLSFILINMATMPFWMIEGLIIYAVLCGYTLYENSKLRNSRRSEETSFNQGFVPAE